jgi:chemotaxis protein MotB
MYSISSVNNGKYRVLSASLNAAFRGTPTSPNVINPALNSIDMQQLPRDQVRKLVATALPDDPALHQLKQVEQLDPIAMLREKNMQKVQADITGALGALVKAGQVTVARKGDNIEVQISNDILFGVGLAQLSPQAIGVLQSLAQVVQPYQNNVRVEGHTDNQPIRTALYPSNWELSAARAASVVHLFMDQGVAPERLSVVGLAEFQPLQSNDSLLGRSANRRVSVIILGTEGKSS